MQRAAWRGRPARALPSSGNSARGLGEPTASSHNWDRMEKKNKGGGGGRKEEKKGLFLPCPSTVQTSRGSSAQHPQCGGWEPPQDDQHGNPPRMTSTGLGTAPRPLPLGNNLGGGGGWVMQNSSHTALHWGTWHPTSVTSVIYTSLAPPQSKTAGPGMSPLCCTHASLLTLPACKTTASPPCSTLTVLSPQKQPAPTEPMVWMLPTRGKKKKPFSSFWY